jgi:hypothetical protein
MRTNSEVILGTGCIVREEGGLPQIRGKSYADFRRIRNLRLFFGVSGGRFRGFPVMSSGQNGRGAS